MSESDLCKLYLIQELEKLYAWVKDTSNYQRDDAPDEIARAILNRIQQEKARSD